MMLKQSDEYSHLKFSEAAGFRGRAKTLSNVHHPKMKTMIQPAVFMSLFSLVTVLGTFGRVDSLACPSVCTCRWKGGKETAECVERRLSKIPSGLSRNTQVLDISRNNLKLLQKEAFAHAGLSNLQKVYIAHCKIRKIDDSAFSQLANLVELDVEGNLLIAVPSETFADYPGLRRLNLNNNPIRRIESNAFIKLPFLALLEMSNCFVEYVGPKAFYGLANLQHLKLDGNRLNSLPQDVGFPIKSLLSLDLFDNPWRCDCQLRRLRDWLANDELPVNAPPVCVEPERLLGRPLVQIGPEEYACAPQTSTHTQLAEAFNGESATLVCSVQADPTPDIRWSRQGRPIVNQTVAIGRPRTYSVHERGNTDRMSILNISPVGTDDSGEYLCTADNLAGQIIVNVTLEVVQRNVEASSLSNGHIASISIGLIIVSVVTIVFICVLLSKMRGQQSDETKHLQLLDKKQQGVHLVNHVKFDVTEEKLEMTTENSVHKPLCSVPNSNYNSNTPIQDKIHLEDTIGGSFRSTSSSRINGSKPDVVNFTCVLQSPYDDNEEDLEEEGHKGGAVVMAARRPADSASSGVDNHSKKNDVHRRGGCTDGGASPTSMTAGSLKRVTKDTSSGSGGGASPRSPFDQERPGVFLSSARTESKERLCEYAQLYDKAASTAVELEERVGRREELEEEESAEDARRYPREYESSQLVTPASRSQWYESSDRGGQSVENRTDGQVIGEEFKAGGVPTSHHPSEEGEWRRTSGEGHGQIGGGGVKRNGRTLSAAQNKRFGPLGNASGILKHVNIHGRNYVPVLPPLPAHHFAQARDSPDEGYEDEVEEEMDM